MWRALRQMAVTYWMQVKITSTSLFDGALAVFYPLMFATAALLVYRIHGVADGLQFAGLGALIMGMWTSQGSVAATLLARERWAGTLELVVAAPTPMPRIIVPTTLALSTIGLYCVVVTFFWERWVFDLPLHISSWPLFVLGIVVAALALSLFSYFLAFAAVRFRTAWVIGASMEVPGWLLCGFVIPLGLLPGWMHAISWCIPTTWAMQAVRGAATGASPWGDLGMSVLVGACWGVLAGYLGNRLIDSARRNATLALT